MFNPNQQPTYTEQVVSSRVQGLRQLEDIFPYEFRETIETIESLYAINHAHESMREYAEASGKGAARRIVELNEVSQ